MQVYILMYIDSAWAGIYSAASGDLVVRLPTESDAIQYANDHGWAIVQVTE